MIKYFISYNYRNGNDFGYGNFEHQRDNEIKDIHDIRNISRRIEHDFNLPDNSVVIINFIKLP